MTETDHSSIQSENKQIPLENARKSLPTLNLEGSNLNAFNTKQTSGSTKAKVPILNLNSGFKINNLDVNKSYKNQETVNESIDKKQIIENEIKDNRAKKMPLIKKLDLGGIINNKDNSLFINNLNNSQIKNLKEDSSGPKEGEESKTTKEEKKHNPLSNILKKTDQDWVEKMKKEKVINYNYIKYHLNF